MLKHTTQADRVKGLLRQRGWRVKELAAHIGCSEVAISNILAGRRRPPLIQRRLAKLADLTPEAFWGEYLSPEIRRGAA